MAYVIKTIQYGEFEEIRKHDSLNDLLHDICCVAAVSESTKILEVSEDGAKLNHHEIEKLLHSALNP